MQLRVAYVPLSHQIFPLCHCTHCIERNEYAIHTYLLTYIVEFVMEHRILLSLQIMKEQQFHKIQIHFVMQLI